MDQPARKARVLIAEDEALSALEIREALEGLGHTVIGVTDSGDAVLRQAIEMEPDVVVLDIHLKSFTDGIDAAMKLKLLKPVPVIFITAYSDPEIRSRAQGVAPAAFFIKPIESILLAKEIDKIMSAKH
jgi:two-component system, response regulator PdtaR